MLVHYFFWFSEVQLLILSSPLQLGLEDPSGKPPLFPERLIFLLRSGSCSSLTTRPTFHCLPHHGCVYQSFCVTLFLTWTLHFLFPSWYSHVGCCVRSGNQRLQRGVIHMDSLTPCQTRCCFKCPGQFRPTWDLSHIMQTGSSIPYLLQPFFFSECSRTLKINPWLSGGFQLLPFSSGNLLVLHTSISNERSKFIAKKTSQLSKLLL